MRFADRLFPGEYRQRVVFPFVYGIDHSDELLVYLDVYLQILPVYIDIEIGFQQHFIDRFPNGVFGYDEFIG